MVASRAARVTRGIKALVETFDEGFAEWAGDHDLYGSGAQGG
jgi:hypothetical protein